MLEMDICGLLQEHILSWAQNSWFVILHMSLVDDFIVYELGLEVPVLGSQEGISQEELSLTSVTVMKWILCSAILSTVPCVHGGEKLRVTSFLPAHTPNAAELGFLRTLWVLEAEKTAGASWVALPLNWMGELCCTFCDLHVEVASGVLKRRWGPFLKWTMYID